MHNALQPPPDFLSRISQGLPHRQQYVSRYALIGRGMHPPLWMRCGFYRLQGEGASLNKKTLEISAKFC